MIPHGVRLNNPGNVRKGADWQGMADIQADPGFVTFIDPIYGIRALAIVLINYDRHHGLHTVEDIIARWAPPSENLTDAYARDVAARLAVGTRDRLVVRDQATLEHLCTAIIAHECANYEYPMDIVAEGVALAIQATA